MSEEEQCHDCGVSPGQQHIRGCDVERCSVCGKQWIVCGCEEHDPAEAIWTGSWPYPIEITAHPLKGLAGEAFRDRLKLLKRNSQLEMQLKTVQAQVLSLSAENRRLRATIACLLEPYSNTSAVTLLEP